MSKNLISKDVIITLYLNNQQALVSTNNNEVLFAYDIVIWLCVLIETRVYFIRLLLNWKLGLTKLAS